MAQITTPVTMPAGASLSAAGFSEGRTLVGILVPATWAAAQITLQSSFDNVNFFNVFDKNGNEYVLTVAATRYHAISAVDLPSLRYIIVRSGTSAVPVVQAAQQILFLFFAETV